MHDTRLRASETAEPVMAVPDGTPPPTEPEFSLQGADLVLRTRLALAAVPDLPPAAVGIVGGRRRAWPCPVVVATCDAAARALGRVPAFGPLVADEVHHLPADTCRTLAHAAVAPFRLGLSATLARSDGRERVLNDLLGDVVYTERPDALAAEGYLAPFDEVRLTVDLGEEHRAAYDRDMGVFRAYRERMARTREPALAFLERVRKRSTFDAAARAALLAYQRARTLALTSQAKIDALEELLARHADERCLIFAAHIDAVEAVGRTYLIPTITSRTPAAERAALTA